MPPPPEPPGDQLALNRAAFHRTADRRATVSLDHAPRYTLEAMYAVSRIYQTYARLQPHRPDLATLPRFSLDHLDGHHDLGRALMCAHTEIGARVPSRSGITELASEGFRLRHVAMAYFDILVWNGAVSDRLVARLRRGTGHRDLVEDLNVIAGAFRALPESVVATSPISPADLARVSEVAHRLLLARSGSPDADPELRAFVDARRRLGALALGSQAQLRRAMEYLRFDEGDAAALVPPLHVPPKRRARSPRPPDPDVS